MSALESSFTSERDSPIRAKSHSLCQQLQQLGAKISNQDLNISKPDTESEDCIDGSFISPNEKNKLDHEPQLQLNNNKSMEVLAGLQSAQKLEICQNLQENNQNVQKSSEKQENIQQKTEPQQNQQKGEQQDQSDSNSSPKTITLIQDDFVSKQQSMNISSKISQYSMEVDNESFATFLSIRDTNYNALVKNFQLLFQSVSHLFSERLKSISQTYLSFLRIKHAQQKAYISVNLGYPQNKRNHIIHIDCKTISEQIRSKIQTQTKQRQQFYSALSDCLNRLQKHVQSTSATLQSKHSKIKQLHNKIVQTVNQMNDLMIPQNRKKQKKNINPQIYSSSFIRTKYLMNKQRTYLGLIANYLRAVLGYVGFVCMEMEPKNCLIVKQVMVGYAQALCSLQSENSSILQTKIDLLSKTNCYHETYEQVSKLLQLCIPQSIKPMSQINPAPAQQQSEKRLKRTIQSLISQSQSLVYIPVIQLENKDYAYHSRNKCAVKWLKIDHTKKYKADQIQELDTHVIVTHQGDLILELINNEEISRGGQQKMAILKLKNIKISRKGNKVFMIDKGNGMLGYLFSTDSVLGSLSFEPLQNSQNTVQSQDTLVDQFIQRVKDVLEDKKDKKNSTK